MVRYYFIWYTAVDVWIWIWLLLFRAIWGSRPGVHCTCWRPGFDLQLLKFIVIHGYSSISPDPLHSQFSSSLILMFYFSCFVFANFMSHISMTPHLPDLGYVQCMSEVQSWTFTSHNYDEVDTVVEETSVHRWSYPILSYLQYRKRHTITDHWHGGVPLLQWCPITFSWFKIAADP